MSSDGTTPLTARIADAPPGNWVDRFAPASWRPYLRLARFDRPIGAWLLFWPCAWSLALAELSLGHAYPNPWSLLLFAVGAWVMRGAGCTYNDIVDRDFDGEVERTASRPIPAGEVSVAAAEAFMLALCAVGLIVLLQFNVLTILLGFASLGLIAVYPFMKRYTYWPQVMLGLTFKWGALVGWTSATRSLDVPALLLYAGCILWTIGYDTIYAHQDKEDDLALGLKSTAIRFGARTQEWLAGFYLGAVVFWALAGAMAGAHLVFFTALAIVGLHMAWQVSTLDIDDPANCLKRFRANRELGFLFFGGLLADMALSKLTGIA